MKIVKVKIEDIKTDLFVRESLNHDHVINLGELIEAGVTLPPIKLTSDFRLIDGRHRKEAYQILGKVEIDAEIIKVSSEAELISLAYKANTGGALIPTRGDTEHTVTLLIGLNQTARAIADALGLPVELTRKYITSVKLKMRRKSLQAAADDVQENDMRVSEAAKKHNVKEDELRELISGKKKKRSNENPSIAIKEELIFRSRSFGQRNRTSFKKLFDAFEDGDISEAEVDQVLDKFEKSLKQSTRTLKDWRARFDQKRLKK